MGVTYSWSDLPAAQGDALLDRPVRFYTTHFREAEVSDDADTPYFVKSRSWQVENCEVGVSMAIYGNNPTI